MENPARRMRLATFGVGKLLIRNQSGVAAVEFALLLPVLVLLIFGIFQFGITLFNYLTITDAVRAGSRQFAMGRGTTTPMSSTTTLIKSAATAIDATKLTFTYSVNGTTCATDAACATALGTAGVPATITVSYPCTLTVAGKNFAPTCNLTATTTERVE